MVRRRRSLYEGYDVAENQNITSPSDPRVFFVVRLFTCNACNNEWESPLTGGENGQECDGCHEVIQGTTIQGETTTPIQENSRRFFGNFKCHQCSRYWSSAHTWANKSQKCRNCDIEIFPFAMAPLRHFRFSVSGEKRPHQTGLCQKCRQLGRDCSKLPQGSSSRRFRGRQRRGRRGNRVINNLVNQMQILAV